MITVIGIIAVIILISILIYWSGYHPPYQQAETIFNRGTAEPLQPHQSLKIMSWNVQCMLGNINSLYHFDGGTDPVTLNFYQQTLKAIATVIKQYEPDIILLQEVLQPSAVLHFNKNTVSYIRFPNQLADLLALLPADYKYYTWSSYKNGRVVPYPRLLGSIGLSLCCISRYPLAQATRFQLPIDHHINSVVRYYYPKRALQMVSLAVSDGSIIQMGNTHLSAFSQGTTTVRNQVKQIRDITDQYQQQGKMIIVAGDFNLTLDSSNQDNELEMLTKQLQAIPNKQQVSGSDKQQWFTMMSIANRKQTLDRTYDYIFLSNSFQVIKSSVIQSIDPTISDHLPVWCEVKW